MALPGAGSSVQWWVIPTTYTNSSGQPGASYIVVSGTSAQIQAKYGSVPNVLGPYATKADAQAAAKGAVSSGKIGVQKPVNKIPNPVSGVTGFLSRLTEQSTWVRVAEVVLGLILIAVGVAKITHAVPIATKVAGIAAKGAVLA